MVYTDLQPLNLCEFIKEFIHSINSTVDDEKIEDFYQEAIKVCNQDLTSVKHTYDDWLHIILT